MFLFISRNIEVSLLSIILTNIYEFKYIHIFLFKYINLY